MHVVVTGASSGAALGGSLGGVVMADKRSHHDRGSHDAVPSVMVEDPNEAKHRRREQGYLMDIGI